MGEVIRHSFSKLKHLARGIEHYLYAVQHPPEQTPAMLLGAAVHCSVLEPDKFPLRYAVWKGGKRQGGEWAKYLEMEQTSGRSVLTESEYEKCLNIRNAVRNDPEAMRVLAGLTTIERRIQWTDKITGMTCSGRPDATNGRHVTELKTTSDVRPGLFRAHSARMLYHAQLVMYVDGLGAESASIIAVEQKPPHAVQVFSVPELTLEQGRYLYRSWLQTVQTVEQFKGRMPEPLTLPVWAGAAEDEVDFNGIEGSE